MSDTPSSPLLGSSRRPTSAHSFKSNESHESQPLLSHADRAPRYDGEVDANERVPSPAATSLRSLQSQRPESTKSTKGGRRWPTIVAVSILGLVVLAILLGAFFAPVIVEEYAKESLVIEPMNLSIHSFTPTGVRARVQANFKLDASRVKNNAVRRIGRIGTWIAKEVESEEAQVEVYLPEYGNVLIGTAVVPGIVVSIRNGRTTQIDFLTDLEPGDVNGVLRIANDWLDGRLGQIRVLGKTDIALKSGLISLGSQKVSESLVFEGQSLYKSFASFQFGQRILA